jgi:hypothetical protein
MAAVYTGSVEPDARRDFAFPWVESNVGREPQLTPTVRRVRWFPYATVSLPVQPRQIPALASLGFRAKLEEGCPQNWTRTRQTPYVRGSGRAEKKGRRTINQAHFLYRRA